MPRQRLPILPLRPHLVLTLMAATLVISNLAFGQAETFLHDFIALPHGSSPQDSLVADSTGNLYGTTYYGGQYSFGTVFKLSSGSNGKWTQTVLYNFLGGNDGAYPGAGLTFDAAGNLYGTTESGGTFCINYCGLYGGGTVFKLSPNSDGTWSESVLHSFGGTGDGVQPTAGVVLDSNSNLFGTTYIGGSARYGIVYELSLSQGVWTETILHTFLDGTDGGNPAAGLTLDKAGNLYGTAQVGGDLSCNNYQYQPIGCGVVFEFVHNSDGTFTETILHNFEQYDGLSPSTNVIFDAAGNLYGTTEYGPGTNCTNGCGTVFQMTPGAGGWTLKTVYTFAGGPDGETPSALVESADGRHFYGTTAAGGNITNCTYGCGTVFELTPTSGFAWRETIIHNFSGSSSAPYGIDGDHPVAGLLFDQFGNLYGTASAGGPAASLVSCNGVQGCSGTVFKLAKNSSGQWVTSLLYTFTATGDGLFVGGSVVSDAAGNLYGTTQGGGAYGYGSVYELVKQSSGGYKERVIYSFRSTSYSDGNYPIGGLVLDAAGNLYGTTYYGGVNAQCTLSFGCGTVFQLTPAGGGKWTETILHAFADADGVYVNAPLTIDSAGNLFGTAEGNSQGGLGTAFELSPSGGGWNFSVLYTFNSSIAYGPNGGMVLDASGNLYGTAAGGLRNGGIVFELSPGASGWTFSVVHDFHGGADGASPVGVTFDKTGALVGVTNIGGSTNCQYGCGTVFALVQVAGQWQKRSVYTFVGGTTDAVYPLGSLAVDAAGNLYGTSLDGGAGCPQYSYGCGTVYKLTYSGGVWHESLVYSFGIVPFDVFRTSQLIVSSSNILYGTGEGGDANYGAVFQIDLNQPTRDAAPPPAQPHFQPRSPELGFPSRPSIHSARSAKGVN
jgi:uncharacterized repeat protein (TIGR03803 family)